MSLSSKRIHSLDYLRGLAACGIMFYHLHLLSFGEVDAASALAKVKIYAVSIFFILSGITLYKVYINKLSTENIGTFFLKRIFRIVPLLWLATIITYGLSFQSEPYTIKKLLTNLMVLPGIIKPEMFIANGAWSIGNECGFYLLFPVILLLSKKNKIWLWISFSVMLIPFLIYTYGVLDPKIPLGLQWKHYVSPFAQFLFFIIGMSFGALKKPSPGIVKFAPLISIFILAVIFLYPIEGEPIVLTAGNNRLFYTILTSSLCYAIFISDFSFFPSILDRILTLFGEISYSVYLLHPLIFAALELIINPITYQDKILIIVLTVILTPILSYLVYNYFEKFFMNLSLTKNKTEGQIIASK